MKAKPVGTTLSLALLWAQVTLPPFPPQGVRYYSLEEFLRAVSERALTLQQAAAQLRPAEWDAFQARFNFLPSLSAGMSVTQNYGTTFDPFAFSRVQQTTTFGSASVQANWILFAGLANHYLLRQARANAAATRAALRRTQAEVLAQALMQFSQTLADSAALVLARQRLDRLQDQLTRVRLQMEAGQALLSDSLSLAAQLAREEAQYLQLFHRHRENKLLLLQLMGQEEVSPDSVEFHLGVEPPELGLLTEKEAIEQALVWAPELEEARWRSLLQQYALKTARAGYWPTLALNASLQTNYSSNAGNIRFDPVLGLVRQPLPFDRQVRENVNQSVNLSLSVPIFRQFRQRAQVVRAEAAVEQASLQERLQRQQVIRRTQQAYLAWRSALAQEQALQRSVEAAERAYQQARLQYEAGRLSYWQYREALLTYTQAQAELAQAQMDRRLRALLLSAYIGKFRDL
ncbi:MAG: TolC family protein [Bacteroidetes bacterium]|nr:MAG: TolC family protein [Bacteroidota bacterium]